MKPLISEGVDNRDGDKMSGYDYDKKDRNSLASQPAMPNQSMHEIQHLKKLLAEAEELAVEFAIEMYREARRAEWNWNAFKVR